MKKLEKIIKSPYFNLLLVAIIILLAVLYFTKNPKIIYNSDRYKVDSLERVIENANISLQKSEIRTDSLEKEDSLSQLRIGRLKEDLGSIKRREKKNIEKIKNQTLKEDSLYFAKATKEPITIIQTSFGTTIIQISKNQLKFTNLHIGLAQSRLFEIKKLGDEVSELEKNLFIKLTTIKEKSSQIKNFKTLVLSKDEKMVVTNHIWQQKLNLQKKKSKQNWWKGGAVGFSIGIVVETGMILMTRF